MRQSTYRIVLDIHDAHSSVCLDMKKNDTARRITIALTDGGFPYQISEECYAVFTATKPDGNIVCHPCRIESNIIIYDVEPQTTAAVGLAECEIKLYGADDKLITSPGFNILISDTSYTEGDEVESETEVSTLTHLISEATTVITEGKNLNEQSEFLIEDMHSKREVLEQQITEAKESAGAAKKHALSSSQSANLATQRATQAAEYAANARTSEANAQSAVETARGHTVNALNAAENARLRQEAAEIAAGSAETAAEKAAADALAAEEYKNQAEQAAYEALKHSTAPDLAQNDPADPGYIKNRTHWVESSETVITWDGSVMGKRTYTDDQGNTYYKISDQCPEESDVIGATIELSNGNILTVSSKMFAGFTDGQANVGSYIYLRSTPAVSAGNTIDPYAVGVYAAIINDVYPAVFRYGKNVVHTLDEKFIPDTIARKTDIPSGSGSGSGQNGNDGFSPIATVTQTDTGAVISITDKTGTTTATISNGKDGRTPVAGTDYFTPADKTEMVNAVIAALPVYNGEVESA